MGASEPPLFEKTWVVQIVRVLSPPVRTSLGGPGRLCVTGVTRVARSARAL